MSKLFKLREWVTLDEAAGHLSSVVSEDVTAADILRLALDGHLVLSANFVNHATARRGKVVSLEDVEWGEYPGSIAEMLPGVQVQGPVRPVLYMRSLNLDDRRYLNLDDDVQTIQGIWDLLLVGNERLDVEHRYQLLTGGPAVTLTGIDGAFVQRNASEVWQLMDSFDDNEYRPGSNAAKKTLELGIALEQIGNKEAEQLLAQHKKDREQFLTTRKSWRDPNSYYPAGALPTGTVLVVRTAALREFEQRLLDEPAASLGRREESTYLNIIGGLLHLLLGVSPGNGKKYSAFVSQDSVIEGLLAHFPAKPGISKRTLESKFAAAKRSIDAS